MPETAKLTIKNYSLYGIARYTGSLEATGDTGAAGIGGEKGHGCGDITIESGTVTATGGDKAAGIGSGDSAGPMGTMTITGGTVTATGGDEAAGIGSGNEATAPGKIVISGGTVTASCGSLEWVYLESGLGPDLKRTMYAGGDYGAGIGGGDQCDGGNVTIEGGTVTAYGGNCAAAIGGGDRGDGGTVVMKGKSPRVTAIGGKQAAGIGSGNEASSSGKVTISSGYIIASSGTYHSLYFLTYCGDGKEGAGIGGGDNTPGADVTINGGIVQASGGVYGAGIGGGEGAAGGSLSITGGNVTTLGDEGAGIGGGSGGRGASVTITGGNVVVKSSEGAGIGSGKGASGKSGPAGGTCTIEGGSVTASSTSGAGIGGGKSSAGALVTISGGVVSAASSDTGAGIGGGEGGTAVSATTISGGTVSARGGSCKDGGGAGIGGGSDGGSCGGVDISGGSVTALGGSHTEEGNTGGAAGIGGGDGGGGVAMRVSGGTVRARGGDGAYGIGRGSGSAAEVSGDGLQVTGGTVLGYNGESDKESVQYQATDGTNKVYRCRVTLNGVADGTSFQDAMLKRSDGRVISSYSTKDITTMNASLHDGNGSLYLYLPHEADTETTELYTVTPTSGTIYTRSQTDTSFYESPTYVVHFDANGGVGTMDDEMFYYGGSKQLQENTFTKYHYVFSGWSTSPTATQAMYADKSLATNIAGDDPSVPEVTLYAVWELDDSSHTIYYTVNDASMGSVSPASEVADFYDDATFKPAGSVATARNGYRFVAWENSFGNTVSYKPLYKPTSGFSTLISLYTYKAIFTPNTYSLLYVSNGGSGTMTSVSGISYNSSKKLDKNAFAREGYAFSGWNTTKDGKGTAYADEATVKGLTTEDNALVALYAQWKANAHTCSFTLNDPDKTYDALPTSTSQEAAFDSLLTEPSVSKKGYVLEGFYTDAALTQKWDFATDKMPDADMTLYAKWEPAQSSAYTVEFWRSADGGSTYQQVASDTLVGAGATASSVDVSAYAGKYEGSTLQTAKTTYADSTQATPSTSALAVKGDGSLVVGLYFDANFYTIRFDAGADDATGAAMDDQAMTYGTAEALPANTFTRAGYRFLGWRVGDTSRYVADGASVSDLTAEVGVTVTLSAMWEAYPDAVLSYNAADPAQGTVTRAMDKLVRGVGTVEDVTATPAAGYHATGWTVYGADPALPASEGATLTADQIAAEAWSSGRYASTNFVAGFAPNAYTVKFNANGGAGDAMADQAMVYDVRKALSANTYSRTGYTFAGWNTAEDGSGTAYGDGMQVAKLATGQLGHESVTLYAQWSPNSYRVVFDANGGSETMGVQGMIYDQTVNLAANGFTRTGYAFTGWNTAKDGSGKSYANKEQVKNLAVADDDTVTLYAQWSPLGYDVLFNANGADETMGSQQMTYDETASLSANAFVRTGYSFAGWNTQVDGRGQSYLDKASVTNLATGQLGNDFVTLYAQWVPNTYTVLFDANGGKGEVIPSLNLTYDAVATRLPQNTYTRDDYAFLGWSTSKTSTSVEYVDQQQISNLVAAADGQITLYAVWNEVTATITYLPSILDKATTSPSTQTAGAQQAATGATAAPVTGYHFINWTVDGSDPVVIAGNKATLSAEEAQAASRKGNAYADTMFTANIQPNTYQIEFKSNGGSGEMPKQPLTYDQAGNLADNVFVDSNGFSFAGWNTQPDGSGTAYSAGASVVNMTEENNATVTLYAQWERSIYTVSWQVNDPDPSYDAVSAQAAEAPYDAHINAPQIQKKGYALEGFYTDAAFTDKWDFESDTVKGDMTLYARWLPTSSTAYAVEFYRSSDGGSSYGKVTGDTLSLDAPTGSFADVTGYAEKYSGYAYSHVVYTSSEYSASSDALSVKGDGSLVVKIYYIANSYTIVFAANGGTGVMSDQAMVYGVASKLLPCAFTRADYPFISWNTARDGSGTTFANLASVKNLSASQGSAVTLYAQWKQTAKVTIDYAASDATMGSVNMTSEALLPQTGVAKGSLASAKDGYHFIGWSDASGEIVSTQAQFVPNRPQGGYASAVYIANFEPDGYTVSFQKNADDATGTMADQTGFLYGTPQTLNPNMFERAGYQFVGWQVADTKKYISNQAEVSDLAVGNGARVVLNAVWKAMPDALISYSSSDVSQGKVSAAYERLVRGVGTQDAPSGALATANAGYHFVKWTLYGGDQSVTVGNDATLTKQQIEKVSLDSSTGLYASANFIAVFQANSYTVRFQANGGTGAPADQQMTFGTSEKLNPNSFAYSNHVFAGWNTDVNGKGVSYSDGESVQNLTETDGKTVTLYAQWADVDSAVISYRTSDASMGVVSPSSETLLQSASAASGSTATVKTGYRFTGWTDSSGAPISSQATLVPAKVGSSFASTFYTANFEGITYPVRFNANGGTGQMDEQILQYGSPESVDACSFKRDGYRFVGWQVKLGESQRYIADGAQVADLSNNGELVTLYAVWQPLPDALISYTSSDQAKGSTENLFDLLKQGVGTPEGTQAVAAAGYHFKEWTVYGTDPALVAGDSSILTKQQIDSVAFEGDHYNSIDFLASFQANDYTVRFLKNSDNAEGAMSDQSMVYGTSMNLSVNGFTHEDYEFLGWNTDPEGAGAWYVDQESVTNLTDRENETVTLYAQWAEVAKVTLSYASDNASCGAVSNPVEAVLPQTGVPQGSVAIPEPGYHFAVWTDASGNVVSTEAKLVPQKTGTSYSDASYTAHFEANAYTVNFEGNGGDGVMSSLSMRYGVAVDLPECEYTRAGYTFAGWNTQPDGSGEKYANAESVSDLVERDGGSIVLYAQWAADALPGDIGDGTASDAGSEGSATTPTTPRTAAGTLSATGDTFPTGLLLLLFSAAGIFASVAFRKREAGKDHR